MDTTNKGYFSPESLAAGVRAEGFAKAQPGNESVSGNVLKPQRQEGNVRSVSYFEAPATNTEPMCELTIEEVASLIKGSNVNPEDDRFSELLSRRAQKAITVTGQLRSLPNEKTIRRNFKKNNFDYVTFSGIFKIRAENKIVADSNLICIDIDHIGSGEDVNEMKKKILMDWLFQTVLLFVSPSGDGLKWVINKTNRGEYSNDDYYSAVSNYLKKQYNIEGDPRCRNVCHSCFLPHDADVVFIPFDQYQKDNEEEYFNPADWLAVSTSACRDYEVSDCLDGIDDEFMAYDWEKEREQCREQVETVVREIEQSGTDITAGYINWVRIGFALSNQFGEDGEELFHRISCLNTDYSWEECHRQFHYCLMSDKRKQKGGITIRTFFHAARENGIVLPAAKSNTTQNMSVNPSEEIPTGADCATQAVRTMRTKSWKDFIVRVDEDIPAPIAVLFRDDDEFIHLGDIQMIMGLSGSKKSFLISTMAAALLGGPKEKCLGFFTTEGSFNKVLYIDTEQTLNQTQVVQRRIFRMCGWTWDFESEYPHDNFKALYLRGETPSERLTWVKEAITEFEPTVCFIDGVKDLTADFNDVKESTQVVTDLMKLSDTAKCAIVCVIHKNITGEEKARGHIGSLLMEKVSLCLGLKVNGDTTEVEYKKGRYEPTQRFAFSINEDALPVLVQGELYPQKENIHSILIREMEPERVYQSSELGDLLSKAMKVRSETAIKKATAFSKEHPGVLERAGGGRATSFTLHNKTNGESDGWPF